MTVGDLHILGATTLDEFRMYVAIDPALDRRFQKVHLSLPTAEETKLILKGIRDSYERHHKLTIPDECIDEVVRLTEEFMRKRNQPDKSIITMDAACGWQNMYQSENRELSLEAVYMMVAKETGLNPAAFTDMEMGKSEAYDPTKNKVTAGAIDFADTAEDSED